MLITFPILVVFLYFIFRDRAYYSGPVPSFEERASNEQFIISFIEKYPSTNLAKRYPYLAKTATAVKAFRELESRRHFMDPADYEIELNRIAGLIDVSDRDLFC